MKDTQREDRQIWGGGGQKKIVERQISRDERTKDKLWRRKKCVAPERKAGRK